MQVMDVVKLLVSARPWKVDEESGVKALCVPVEGLTEAATSRMGGGCFHVAPAAAAAADREGAKQSRGRAELRVAEPRTDDRTVTWTGAVQCSVVPGWARSRSG